MTSQLPFTVIGGYLGAGKTTLLNHLLTQTQGRRMAVLINDFGDVNIDASLIADHDGDTISLANGCLCCSLVNGFAAAIHEVLRREDAFDHLVIEASGVADPAKIAQYGQMYELPLDSILVMVDAEQIGAQADNVYVGDTVLRQLQQADVLILNKTDLIDADSVAEVKQWLSERAPKTPILETRHAEVPHEIVFGHPRESSPRNLVPHQAHHGGAFQSWTVKSRMPLTHSAIQHFAESLDDGIYRAKGFVHLQDDPGRRYIYQQVGSRWSLTPGPAWEPSTDETVVVVIGRPRQNWAPSIFSG